MMERPSGGCHVTARAHSVVNVIQPGAGRVSEQKERASCISASVGTRARAEGSFQLQKKKTAVCTLVE